jgi:hypothetical protein
MVLAVHYRRRNIYNTFHFIIFILLIKNGARYFPLDRKRLKWCRRGLTVKYILEPLTVAWRLNRYKNIKKRNEFFVRELTKTIIMEKVFYSKCIRLKNKKVNKGESGVLYFGIIN